MIHTMMRYELTVETIFKRAAAHFPETEIVSRLPSKEVVRTTYADFSTRALALARALVGMGIGKGDRVATLMWNHYAHIETYYAIPLAGGVLHTLNLRLHPDDIGYIAAHANDRVLIVDDVLLPLYEKFKHIAKFEKVIVVSLTGQAFPKDALDYEAVLRDAPATAVLPTVTEEDPMGMCYTSGTTGKPKGVVYAHRTIALHSMSVGLVDNLGLSHHDTVLAVVPMFHVNAWGLPFAAVMLGAKQVMPGPHLDAVSLLDLMATEKVTMAAGVPTIWMAILQALDKEPTRWKLQPGLRMVVGGSAVPESMIRAFDKHGMRIVHAWGMTETAPLGTVSNLGPESDGWTDDQKYALRATQGVPSPFIELRTMGEKGEAPKDGKTSGELEVRGAWVAGNYHELPEEKERWSPDGWFRTGDVATLDGHGRMRITDRTKDLIKSGGEWISSVDLENTLMGHPLVKEAAVIAVPHPKWAERPLAVVVAKEGASVTEAELRAYLEGKVAKWWIPEAIDFIDAIPRTSAGKFLKTALREKYKDWKWE